MGQFADLEISWCQPKSRLCESSELDCAKNVGVRI